MKILYNIHLDGGRIRTAGNSIPLIGLENLIADTYANRGKCEPLVLRLRLIFMDLIDKGYLAISNCRVVSTGRMLSYTRSLPAPAVRIGARPLASWAL